ncbi:MAG: glycosyltransferase family 4 protein [Rhodospirillales bacterium]|nr:glycosyltransferase family 4 protein [Rhodospirillales bacterium]
MAAIGQSPKKLLFLVTEDWYFWSHRLPMARKAKALGFDVVVATRINQHQKKIEGEGFRVVPLSLDRKSKNPFKEIAAILDIAKIYRWEKPDLIHHVALKPVLYGSVAARLAGIKKVINAFAGMGFVFIAKGGVAQALRPFLVMAFRLLLNHSSSHVVLQNHDDQELFQQLGIGKPERTYLIKGSGVSMTDFPVAGEPTGTPIATFVGRMLWDKGVGELVEAARLLKEKGITITVQLVGTPDPANPKSIPQEILEGWKNEGVIEWLGHREDIADLWEASHIAVLPSYREGLPKSLLEAASCGRPMVATDVPGCRELVNEGSNGLLIPSQDAERLAEALEKLATDPTLRKKYGKQARLDVEASYSEEAVSEAIGLLYQQLSTANG